MMRRTETKQLMCWGLSIITFVVAGIGGVNTSSIEPATAATFFLKVVVTICLLLSRLRRNTGPLDWGSISPHWSGFHQNIGSVVLQTYLYYQKFSSMRWRDDCYPCWMVHFYCHCVYLEPHLFEFSRAWAKNKMQAQILAGKPISGAWKPVPSMRYDYGSFGLANAGMGIVFDVVVLCFPLPVIKSLQIKTRRKLMIVGIFWLGGL